MKCKSYCHLATSSYRKSFSILGAAGLLLLLPSSVANAQVATSEPVARCVVPITTPDGGLGGISDVTDTSVGVLVAASSGLYEFDGLNVARAPGSEALSGPSSVWETQAGIVIATDAGLYEYDGSKVLPIAGGSSLGVSPEGDDVQDTAFGVIVNAGQKVFRYDGVKLVPIPGDFRIKHTKDSVFGFNDSGLFRYDGTQFATVPGSRSLGQIYHIEDTKFGVLVAAEHGLFRVGHTGLVPITDDPSARPIYKIWNTKLGVLFSTPHLVFRYDGSQVTPFSGYQVGGHIDVLDTKGEVVILPEYGERFRTDGSITVALGHDALSTSSSYGKVRTGILLTSSKGLSLYESGQSVPILGGSNVTSSRITGWDTSRGTFLQTDDGSYVLVDDPLTSIKVSLDNRKEIDGASITRSGVPTHWTINDRCAEFAGDLGFAVVPSKDRVDQPAVTAIAGRLGRDQILLMANVPVERAGTCLST